MRIVVADEISPDNCRLWDSKTNEKMDKDRFRRDPTCFYLRHRPMTGVIE